MSPWALVAVPVTQIGQTTATEWPSETNMVPDGSPDTRVQHYPWLHQEQWIWTQTLAEVGSWTKTWSTAATLQWTILWTQVAMQAIQTSMALEAAQSLNANMATGCSLDPRHQCGLWWHHGYRCQQRSWLWEDHGPRQGPHQLFMVWCHHGPSWQNRPLSLAPP